MKATNQQNLDIYVSANFTNVNNTLIHPLLFYSLIEVEHQ